MGIQQGLVTVTGNLGAHPTSFSGKDGTPACSFRVGVTPRYFDSRSGQWRDRGTSWINVRAYRTLAMNVMGSLHKGDPVIVTGTLHTDRWQKDGVDREMPVIEASAVGHDLSQGVANFGRRRQPNMNPPAMQTAAGQAAGQPAGAGQPVPMPAASQSAPPPVEVIEDTQVDRRTGVVIGAPAGVRIDVQDGAQPVTQSGAQPSVIDGAPPDDASGGAPSNDANDAAVSQPGMPSLGQVPQSAGAAAMSFGVAASTADGIADGTAAGPGQTREGSSEPVPDGFENDDFE